MDSVASNARELALLDSCAAMLSWDEETYMPSGGAVLRGDQQALLAGLVHDRLTDGRWGALLDELTELAPQLDPMARRDVAVLRERRMRALRVPRALASELARVVTESQDAWARARDQSDFDSFRPHLERVVALKRSEASALGEGDAFAVLAEQFEPELDVGWLRALLDDLGRALTTILEDDAPPITAPLSVEVPVAAQRRVASELAELLGFDGARGRIDEAAHPSTIHLGPGDTRLTTRFEASRPFEGMLTVLHELGHALFDQHMDPSRFGLPSGEARSAGLHESQARLLENMVGRNRGFWSWLLPRVVALAPALDRVSLDAVTGHLRTRHRSPIRVHADEVAYNLHIVVRVDLEHALLTGDLAVGELPSAWREGYRRRLGIEPSDDREGCLQDGHWAAGMFGYFPSYVLGNLIAAQLWDAADRALGSLDALLAAGEARTLLQWLRANVHAHTGARSMRELVVDATGAPLSTGSLEAHLRRRYVLNH